MKKQLLSAVMLCTLGLVGCGDDTTPTPGNPDTGPKYNTADKISTYLEGKTLVMTGDNIPSHPNGYSEDTNLGPNTQCYVLVTMTVAGGQYRVVGDLGTLRETSPGVQKCDRTTKSGQSDFTTKTVLIENVKEDGSCFDVTYNFGIFKQMGRGQVSQDGKTLKVELFFENQATGSRCADGEVGAPTVIFNKQPFTGNAVQTYTIQ
ncbi:hypothetical protein JRI60_50495 [Archangium violaceum]|uniref:hypothetical protein n=1 Tax=Archangium violaceum TaxID=83451 RepID=UPI0019516AA9|nr:hypothetical protein [Archangium violaceum]QRN97101.1 hypothetical protein JRI60_50495 [Archangium violaceum]